MISDSELSQHWGMFSFFRCGRYSFHMNCHMLQMFEGEYSEEEEGKAMEAFFTCWDAHHFTRIRRRMRALRNNLGKTTESYILSTNIANALAMWKGQCQLWWLLLQNRIYRISSSWRKPFHSSSFLCDFVNNHLNLLLPRNCESSNQQMISGWDVSNFRDWDCTF